MGQAQSIEWLTPGDVGFLPSLHLLTIEPGDIERLFIPHHLAARCQLYEGCSIELVDYLDRQFTVHVSKATYSHYLAEGWSEFLSAVGAKCCDFMLIEFKNTRQCKVAVFGRYGVQKYPPLEAEHVQKLLHPRNSDHSWPEVYSPETAIKVGPCTKPSPPATIGEQSPPSALSCN